VSEVGFSSRVSRQADTSPSPQINPSSDPRKMIKIKQIAQVKEI